MRSVMTTLIYKRIENDLINENYIIKNYIYEKIILNFMKGFYSQNKEFDVQNNENFIKSTITLIVYNTYYFLNKKMSDQTFSLIKKEEILRNNINNYIIFYKEKTNSFISNGLNNLAFKLLNIQAKKEQELGQPTLMQNKRNGDDFIASNKTFFYDKFYCLAQKYYIWNFITYSCESMTNLFEDSFNRIIRDFLNNDEIKNLINNCFLKKYHEFEEKIKTQNNLLLIPNNLKASTQFYTNLNGSIDLSSNSTKNNPYSDIKSVSTIPLNIPHW